MYAVYDTRSYTLQYSGTEKRLRELKGPKHGWTHPSISIIASCSVPTSPSFAPYVLEQSIWEGRTHTINRRQYISHVLVEHAELKAYRSSARAEGYGPDGGHSYHQNIFQDMKNLALSRMKLHMGQIIVDC